MKLIKILALLTVFFTGSVASFAQESDGTIMRRTTLLVHDIEASVKFYESYLNYTVWYQSKGGKVSGEGLPVVDAEVGEPTKFIIMKGKDPYVGMVGLLQYGHTKTRPDITKPRMRAGSMVLMIEMRGLRESYEKMLADGYPVYKAPEQTHIKSVDSEWDALFMYVLDPDGNMLELTERLN